MVRSMTGFGRAESNQSGRNISVEIRAVNHRYLEFSCRVPRSYGFLEERLKNLVQQSVARGKVDMYVSIEQPQDACVTVSVNHPLAEGYVKALKEIAETYGLSGLPTAESLARLPDILSISKEPEDEDSVWNDVMLVAKEAIEAFNAMRSREGERLVEDVRSRLVTILDDVAFVEQRSPETVSEYRSRLESRIRELLGDHEVDEQRLLTETAVFADRIAVAEETVRLRSHIIELEGLFNEKAAVGRRMDFIVQEMNREANTTGSKCLDAEITRHVVNIKSEIEKIREQIQNIE